jgi:Transposase, Mutator family
MTAAQTVDKLISTEHANVIRESVRLVVAELMEAEVAEMIGAARGGRAPERRSTQCTATARAVGHARRLELAIPRLRSGPAYFPSFSATAPTCRVGAGRGPPIGRRQRRLDAHGLGAVSEFAMLGRWLACENGTLVSPVRLAGGCALPRHKRGVVNTELATA